jgi:hypothetical protein
MILGVLVALARMACMSNIDQNSRRIEGLAKQNARMEI